MRMTDYHFVSTWRLQAPIEQVWEEIFHTERWPSWWKYVHRVDQLDPGDADGLGKRQHLVFTTRLPYRLGFDIQVRHIQPPSTLEAVATGELDGVGRWTLTPDDSGTLVRYDWDVRTTKWWMNLAAPVARPVFTWNHDALMREAAQGLANRLDAELELPSAGSRPGQSARTLAWACLLMVLLALVVARWRRRA
jgi:Polyketide cyclase / dehydrase and lipid transport